MEVRPVSTRRKRLPGYNTLRVIWHESISDDFDLPSTLKALAEAHGLVTKDKTTKGSRQFRIDTVESAQSNGRQRALLDKSTQLAAVKLFRHALRDPRSAERIRTLVERARLGEDVDGGVADAIDPEPE
jgi:hypothetical protein